MSKSLVKVGDLLCWVICIAPNVDISMYHHAGDTKYAGILRGTLPKSLWQTYQMVGLGMRHYFICVMGLCC